MRRVFDVSAVREQFPALGREYGGRGVTYFDGPGGSQVCRFAIEAMRGYMERGGANLHGVFPTSLETEEIIARTRAKAAAFLGAEAGEIAFGANMTTLTYAVSRGLARGWEEGDEVVVTELDHRANVDPWTSAAEERGAKVQGLPVGPKTLTLDLSKLEETITDRTRLVAVGLASNAVGTINDVKRIAERAHEVGALVAVDAVHAAPHISIDRDALGADIITCSAYKFFGPHVGLAAVKRSVFEELRPYRLEPAPTHAPDKLETGTQNHEGIAGVEGALDFIASLGGGDTLRERFVSGMQSVEDYEDQLAGKLRSGLRALPGVTVYAAPDGARKTPTVAFRVKGRTPREVCEVALGAGYFVAGGDFYASTLSEKLGLRESGGWVRAGLAPYSTEDEVDGLVREMQKLVTEERSIV